MANVTLMDSVLGTYATFSGCDAIATFNNQVIGELQAITINITREKGPVYVLGNANPISFSRGKRGIAGTMVLATFDRNQLREALMLANRDRTSIGFTSQYGSPLGTNSGTASPFSGLIVEYDALGNVVPTPGNRHTLNVYGTTIENYSLIVQDALNDNQRSGGFRALTFENINYEDQLPPFDITITFGNEYGSMAHMTIYKCEILNEGLGISVDDLVLERSCTFVARAVDHIKPGPKRTGVSLSTAAKGPAPSYYSQLGLSAGQTPLGGGLPAELTTRGSAASSGGIINVVLPPTTVGGN